MFDRFESGKRLRHAGSICGNRALPFCRVREYIVDYGDLSAAGHDLEPAVAYALAWLVGLVIVAVAYPKFVFGVTGGWARGGAIAITYAIVFVVGLLLIKLLRLPNDS